MYDRKMCFAGSVPDVVLVEIVVPVEVDGELKAREV